MKAAIASMVEILEAVKIGVGEWAYLDEETGRWYITTDYDLIQCQVDDEYGLDEHSTLQPVGWTPSDF